MAKNNVRQVSIFINGNEVVNSIKAIAAEQKKLTNEVANTIRGTAEYEAKSAELAKVNAILRSHREQISGIKKGWDLTKIGLDKFVGVAAGAFAVDSLLGYGKQLFNTGVQMEAMAKKAKTVFGEALPQVSIEAEKNARAMGLTNSQYVAAAANIQDLLVPMGFQRKAAADISTQLVNLSGALSEWTGGQRTATEVADILQAALLGERERLKELGIAISEADVKAALAAKGLDKLTGAALEQAKATSTLELILNKSRDAQAQFAEGSDSLVRRQAELSARIKEIIERISIALIPVFEKLAAVANGVATALEFVFGTSEKAAKSQLTLSEQTKKTQLAFNAEIETLTKGNFTQEERARLIKEINSKYVEYLPNLLSEKASIDDIRIAQEKANKVFAQKIVFQSFQEKITEATKQAADAADAAYEAEKRRQELLRTQAAPDSDNAQKALNLQVGLQKAIREEAVETVKAAPQQAAKIREIYDQLAAGLGTTLAELEKKFGVVEGKAKTAGKGKGEENTDEAIVARIRAVKDSFAAIQKIEDEQTTKRSEDFLRRQNAELEAYNEKNRKKLDLDLNYEEEKAALQEEIRLTLLTDQEAEIESLQAHYDTMILLAEQYGIDTSELRKKQEEELAAINKKYSDEEAQRQYEANQARLAALSSMFSEFGNLATATFDLLAGEGEKSAAFQKVATLAKIAFDTASAISSLVAASEANPANAFTFGAAGVAQYVAGLVRILSNIAQAKKILSGAPKVQQKSAGGFLSVAGADDGRTYRAGLIASPATGLLPDHPVLFQSRATGAPVLASERGAEYFVSSDALRNPYVADLTRMIDNIAGGGRAVAQFAEGGSNPPAPAQTAQPAVDMSVMRDLAASLNALNALISRGIVAVIPDRTLSQMPERLGKINDASGGFFG